MIEKMSGVYAIVNIWNGNQYIGSSVSLRRRKSEHLSALRNGRHHSAHMQRAFDKYGESAFEWRAILYCETADLLYYEQSLIDLRVPVYNTSPIAGNQQGLKHTPETRRIMSEKARRRAPISEETRHRQSAAQKRRVRSPEELRALREHNPGLLPVSEETRARQSESQKRRFAKLGSRAPVSEETRRKLRKATTQRWTNPEYHARLSASRRLRPPASPETRAKLSNVQRGKKATPETRAKMSEAQKARRDGKRGSGGTRL